MTDKKRVHAIAVKRVSSDKQGLAGDSNDDQEQQILGRVQQLSNQLSIEIVIKKWFEFTESASGELELQPIVKAIEYCKDKKIRYLFIKSIDRMTRAGSAIYGLLKTQLAKYGVDVIDVYGVISQQRINTLEHLGIKYKWSEYSPSFITELLEAERAKSEVRDILTRLISAEIRYVRSGYRVRPAPMGFINQKVDTAEQGRRVTLSPHPEEAEWFIQMFELAGQGNLSDLEVVDGVNAIGFKSRVQKLHDKNDKTKVIGFRGGKPLTVKQLQRYIRNPIYAGVNDELWTEGKPVKCKFDGLVSIELFNKANKGKVRIVEEGDTIRIVKGKTPEWLLTKHKDNPLFPYKEQVLCPTCKQPLLGSAPRSKSGKHVPTYHCGRKHKYWGINKIKFDITISEFVKEIRFSEKFKQKFREVVLDEWEKRRDKAINDSTSQQQRVLELTQQKQLIVDKIKVLTNPISLMAMEQELEKLEQTIAQATYQRDKKEEEQVDIEVVLNYSKFFMEHLEELLLGSTNPFKNASLFGLVFDEPPTYSELVNRTPRLAPLFELNEKYNTSKTLSVSRVSQEWNTFESYFSRIYATFQRYQIQIPLYAS